MATDHDIRRAVSSQEATAKLLTEFAAILNGPGPDSAEAKKFLDDHETNVKLVRLARLSAILKRALTVEEEHKAPD